MENLNAEQVKKALECCENELCDACENCPSPPNTSGGCVVFVMRQSLALINSQEQRIKELTVELEAMRGAAEAWKVHGKTLEGENENLKNLVDKCFDTENALNEKVKKLTEENERLKAQKYYIHSDGRIEMIPSVESVRADTVRKMQERAIAAFNFGDDIMYSQKLVHGVINHIAKDMVEGEK